MTEIVKKLFELSDSSYRDFHSRLMPTIPKDTIIGVRTPKLRSFAKELYKKSEYDSFLKNLPHNYYEENNLHAFIVEQISDFDLCLEELGKFLPYIDNWATCDMLRPAAFKKNPEKLLKKIWEWLSDEHPFTVRFGIEMLMVHFLDEMFEEKYLEIVSGIRSDEYYVNMMIAWYFATALSKQYSPAVAYIENKKLSKWVHNKTIQKAVESYRITNEKKAYLKTLKIK